ncbi:MAG TPA: hypothetical protein VKE22_19310 [Haliangiales bacterium]|nr:hypothetical protein [Haliangiales bacterium]
MTPSDTNIRPGWRAPKPAVIPEPTAWPSALGLAIALVAWGILGSPILVGIGLVLFAAALRGWIGDIRHEADRH